MGHSLVKFQYLKAKDYHSARSKVDEHTVSFPLLIIFINKG